MFFNDYKFENDVLILLGLNDYCCSIILKENGKFNIDSISKILDIEKNLENFNNKNFNNFFNSEYKDEYEKFKNTKKKLNEIKNKIINYFNINEILGDYSEIENFQKIIAKNKIISNSDYEINNNEKEINLINVFGITDSYCVFQHINYNIFDLYFNLQNNNFYKNVIKINDEYYLGINTNYLFVFSFLINKGYFENKIFKIDGVTEIFTKK